MCQLVITLHHSPDAHNDPYDYYNCPTEKPDSTQADEKICCVTRSFVVVKRVIKREAAS